MPPRPLISTGLSTIHYSTGWPTSSYSTSVNGNTTIGAPTFVNTTSADVTLVGSMTTTATVTGIEPQARTALHSLGNNPPTHETHAEPVFSKFAPGAKSISEDVASKAIGEGLAAAVWPVVSMLAIALLATLARAAYRWICTRVQGGRRHAQGAGDIERLTTSEPRSAHIGLPYGEDGHAAARNYDARKLEDAQVLMCIPAALHSPTCPLILPPPRAMVRGTKTRRASVLTRMSAIDIEAHVLYCLQ